MTQLSDHPESPSPEEMRSIIEDLRAKNTLLEHENETLRNDLSRHSDLYAQTSAGYVTFDPRGVILDANHAAAHMLGLPEAELPGTQFIDLVYPEDRDLYTQNLARFLASGKPHQYELRLLKRDMTSFWVQLKIAGALKHNGTPVYSIVLTDITQYHQVMKALKASEERYRLVTTMMSDYVFKLDVGQDGGIMLDMVTDTYFRDTGRTLEEAKATGLWENFLHPGEVGKVDDMLRRLVSTGGIAEMECRACFKDNRTRWVRVLAQAVTDVGCSRTVAVVGSVEDISKRKLAEDALLERSQQLFNLADNLPNVMLYQVIGDLEGNRRFTYVGRSIKRLNEIAVEELMADAGMLYRQFLPEYQLVVRKREEEALARMEPFQAEVQSLLPSGRLRWFRFNSTPRRLHSGVVVWDGVEVDITERKDTEAELEKRVAERTVALSMANLDLEREIRERRKAQLALKESERQLLEAQHLSHIGSWHWSADHGNVHFSTELSAIAGRGADGAAVSLSGNPPLFTEESQRIFQEAIDISTRLGEPYELSLQIVRPDGSLRDVICRGRPEKDEHGLTTGHFGTVQDVTEWRQAEKERRSLEAQVQHAKKMESLGVLAGGLAHDFNNILQIILANVNLMHKIIPGATLAHPYIQNVERSVNRAAALTRQMLAYAGQGGISLQAMDIGTIIGEIVHLIRSSVSKKVTLQLSLSKGLPLVEIDAAQIQQVVMNLVINASESLDEERGGLVSVSTKVLHCDLDYLSRNRTLEEIPEGDYVCLEVSDTGSGMSEEMTARLFDPFYTTKFTGRGLGMSAVLGIIRSHKGAILVESNPGAGTTVQALFPISAYPAAEESAEPQEVPAPAAKGTGTILFVDDETEMLDIGALELQQMGYRVLTAADGLDAIEIVKTYSGDIDCVLLDLSMPRMDGREALLELRRIRPDLRVILMSGYAEQEIELRISGQNVDGFIEKPYTADTLSEVLRKTLN